MKRKEEEKGIVFGVGVKGEGKGIRVRIFLYNGDGRGSNGGLSVGRGVLSGLKYFEGVILVEGCRM